MGSEASPCAHFIPYLSGTIIEDIEFSIPWDEKVVCLPRNAIWYMVV